jgi:hypothetical protein
MTDVAIPDGFAKWRIPNSRKFAGIALRTAAAVFFLFSFGLIASAVATDIKDRRCEGPIGRLAVALKLDVYYSHCRCVKPSFDFRDACNSKFLPML